MNNSLDLNLNNSSIDGLQELDVLPGCSGSTLNILEKENCEKEDTVHTEDEYTDEEDTDNQDTDEECALQEAVDVRNNRITDLVNEKLNHLKLELSTFLEQKEMNCTAVDKSEMSSLYEEVINANQQLTEALERIVKDLTEPKKVTKLSLSQFGYPYFKDKQGNPLGVYKVWKDKIGMGVMYKTPKMTPKQEAKLKEAVLQELERIALKKLQCLREDINTDLAERVAAGITKNKTLISRLENLDKRISEVTVNPLKWFNDPQVYNLDLIDFKKIAVEVFPNHLDFDDVSLRRWWQCHLDPTFERGKLTVKEVRLLKELTKEEDPVEGIDFDMIAVKMAKTLKMPKRRHRFQIGQYYQKRLNTKNRKFGWKKEEAERLQLSHLKYSTYDPPSKRTRVDWDQIKLRFPGRTRSQMETYLRRAAMPATARATPSKRVVVNAKPRGRPKKPEKSALHLKIAKLLSLYKCIRRGNRRITPLPGDGRRNGLILSAIQRLMPLKTDQGKIPREASELVAAGVAEKDLGAVEVMLSLPESNLNSKISFPPNLASLTGLRGLMLSLEGTSQSVEVEIEPGTSETEDETCCLGDPVEDQQLLFVLEKCFGSWARPFFDTEAPLDGAVVDLPVLTFQGSD